jgi:hypothetical protein
MRAKPKGADEFAQRLRVALMCQHQMPGSIHIIAVGFLNPRTRSTANRASLMLMAGFFCR